MRRHSGVVALLCTALSAASAGAATTESTLFSFCAPAASRPDTGLVRTTGGSFFGSARGRDASVFKLAPSVGSATGYSQTVLHMFPGYVEVSLPVLDSQGSVFGTAQGAQAFTPDIVFRLDPPASGQTAWTYSVIHTFNPDQDGALPVGGLVIAGGALYGTTSNLGPSHRGTVFQLSPPGPAQSSWQYSVLHAFGDARGESGNPQAPVLPRVVSGRLTLFGTTSSEFTDAAGGIFALTAPLASPSAWTFRSLYVFPQDGSRGSLPRYALNADRSLNLYGVTSFPTARGSGLAFRLSPPATEQTAWSLSVLRDFAAVPAGPLFEDDRGSLYGTAFAASAGSGGAVFKITPSDFGGRTLPWNYATTFSFPGAQPRGFGPSGALVGMSNSSALALFGTTGAGGSCSGGTAYRLDIAR